jgi:hypothetical protein
MDNPTANCGGETIVTAVVAAAATATATAIAIAIATTATKTTTTNTMTTTMTAATEWCLTSGSYPQPRRRRTPPTYATANFLGDFNSGWCCNHNCQAMTTTTTAMTTTTITTTTTTTTTITTTTITTTTINATTTITHQECDEFDLHVDLHVVHFDQHVHVDNCCLNVDEFIQVCLHHAFDVDFHVHLHHDVYA